jgi:hypothetical protein
MDTTPEDIGLTCCETYEHGIIYWPTEHHSECPACAALRAVDEAVGEANRRADLERSAARRAQHEARNQENARYAAERKAQNTADDLAWRRKIGTLMPWER